LENTYRNDQPPIGAASLDGVEWIALEKLSQSVERVGGMVVCSDPLRKIIKTIERLSPFRQSVLIEGESGTGKELIARALHSSKTAGPFITFNCSNLVDSLAESQLFGHVKGAFTDAREDSLGYFRSAGGGTLFLDEIGELPLKLQPKLLRAVENREIQPVGSSRNYQIDIRLVCATNRDLRAMMKAGTFREDLYYRLNSATIMLPPLRERSLAVPALVAHFAAHYGNMFDKAIRFIARPALSVLCAYPWPGNIRELAHVVESAVMMTDSDRISVEDLAPQILANQGLAVAPAPAPLGAAEIDQFVSAMPADNRSDDSPLLLDDIIKETLVRSIQHTGGNRRRAADLLGVSRSTLYRMLARFDLDDSAKREVGSSLNNYA